MNKYIYHAILFFAGSLFISIPVDAQHQYKGRVYLDINENFILDADEKGLANVLVSNGREIVSTNQTGLWELSAENSESIFVIKPSGFDIPVNTSMIPQHFLGSGFEKVPTDFPLWEGKEKEHFEAILFGDTQARGLKEVNYVSHDVVEECIGSDAAFGVALGDMVADDPGLFDEISASIGKIGIPWYYVFGNHDHDKDASGNDGADDTFVRNFGPSSYAFEFGKVAFISLNNVDYKKEGGYKAHFSDDQIKFVDNYLKHVPNEKLIVLMMHIPIVACDNKEEMFRLLENRSHTLSISGHTHTLANIFVDESNGWKGTNPHHHFINGTVSGSWWCGMKDELGIPHATMNDGAPNGYAIISFKGSEYNIRFKGARRPADYQMNIYLPNDISVDELDITKVLVNVFNGSEKSTMEMQIDHSGAWLPLEQVIARDPANLAMHKLGPYLEADLEGKAMEEVFGWKMDYPSLSNHFWQGDLTNSLNNGTHLVTIRTIDMFGNTYLAHRVFRVSNE